jgi:DNA-binding transcriptional LysR family regulator
LESNYLKTLIEVARTGNLTKTADSLCVTQSAISRRIKFLETQYGCELIDRTGPILKMTPKGELVLEKAQKILEIEQELLLGLTSAETQQEIVFVCTPTFGIVHLPDLMREFMLICPDSNNLKFIFKMPADIVKGLQNGLYDMAVIEHCKCFDLLDLETVQLRGDEMVFAAAPSLGLGTGLLNIETVLNQTLYGRPDGCCARTLLESNLNALDHTTKDFHRVVDFDDLHVIVKALVDGLGIGFISSDLIAPHIQSGKLIASRVTGFTHQRSRSLILNGQYSEGCPSAQFINILTKQFQ